MRKTNTQSLREVLGDYSEELNLSRKIKEIRLVKQWPDLMGPAIARVTDKLYIRNKTLYVHLSSSVARNELFMMREAIVQILNKKAGEKIIHKVILK
jgi:predicted nucleic acid-binding Zn ribbon protein